MVKKSLSINFVWVSLFIFIFNSCSNDRNKKVVDSYSPKISFSDQVELTIEDKYFTIQIDSASRYFGFGESTWRVDIEAFQLLTHLTQKRIFILDFRTS